MGALGFGAAAWKVAARDRWIGWERPAARGPSGARAQQRPLLILPWVEVKNLASKVLALATARVGEDFAARYGERPVLLETFVETPRFQVPVTERPTGVISARRRGGASATVHQADLPRKAVYVYPLVADFRAALGVA